jgi:hypothetical protein
MEEDIQELTVVNQVRRTFKEKLIELLPEMYTSMMQGRNRPTKNLLQIVKSLEDNQNKAELLAILQQ